MKLTDIENYVNGTFVDFENIRELAIQQMKEDYDEIKF